MRQSRKLVYTAGWRNKLPSVCRNSLQFMTYECIKDSIIGKMADIETFVITEGNGAQREL